MPTVNRGRRSSLPSLAVPPKTGGGRRIFPVGVDAGRLDAPMIAAADAVLIDSTTLDAEAVFTSALHYLSEKFDGLQTEKRILI